MENLQKYLSTAPVLLTIWLTFTAGFIIEINRFFPDMLGLYFQQKKSKIIWICWILNLDIEQRNAVWEQIDLSYDHGEVRCWHTAICMKEG